MNIQNTGTHQNDIQQISTHQNDTQHFGTQQNDIQPNDTEVNIKVKECNFLLFGTKYSFQYFI
jgi:hypothetical protein